MHSNKACRCCVTHISLYPGSILGSFSFSFLLCCASCMNLPKPKSDFLSYTLNDAKIHSSTVSKSVERNQVIFISIPTPPILLVIQTDVIQSPTKFLKTICVKGVFMQLQEMLHPLLQTAVSQKMRGLNKIQSSWSSDSSWLSMCMQTAREYFSCFRDTVKYTGVVNCKEMWASFRLKLSRVVPNNADKITCYTCGITCVMDRRE